jgi:hypothetical protein
MTEIRDGDELSIDIPEGGGTCFVYPPSLEGASSGSAACAAVDRRAPTGFGREVAWGVVHLDGVPTPAKFAVRFVPDPKPAEPTPESARDFGSRESAYRGPAAAEVDGDAPGASGLSIVAVGSSPGQGIPSSEVVTLGALRAARAVFTLDLHESGHDVPLHVAAYGAWSREGLYVLSVEGDAFHAAAVDAFADEAAKTILLKNPAPPAPSEVAVIGARLGQIGLGVLVLGAVVVAVLGIRTRRLRG